MAQNTNKEAFIEVEGGEYVLNSDAVRKYGVKMLDNINSLKFNPIIKTMRAK